MILTSLLLAGAFAIDQGDGGFALRDGDRVAFYGDSITEQGHYTNLVEAFVACRFPKLKIEFFNVGWAGDTTWGTTGWDRAGGTAEERVSKDLKPLHPTVVTVMLGMNDGGYVPFDPKIFDVFSTNYEKLIGLMKAASPQAKFTLIRTSPWDDVTRAPSFTTGVKGEGGYNSTLLRFGEKVREMAQKHGFRYVDFNLPMIDAMRRADEIDKGLAQQFVPDWIHPGPAGGLVMANELLKAWGAPTTVFDVRLDAKRRAVVTQENTNVSDFDGLSWTQTDRYLPFPIDRSDKAVELASRCCDLLEKLNRQTIAVDGLSAGTYALLIDGTKIGSFDASELVKGVNLGKFETPMAKQSLEVHRITVEKNHVFFAQWREVQRPFGDWKPATKAAKAVDELRRALVAKQRETAKPTKHRFELRAL